MKNYNARRRGTSVAAAALSFALVAPFAQPVAVAAPAGAETTVDGQTFKCGLDNSDPRAAYNTELMNVDDAVVADAIENGYVRSNVSMGNARNTVTGYLRTAGFGDLLGSGGRDLPNGIDVYMQWKDTDGTTSPVYTTKTHEVGDTALGRVNSAFAFDLREPFEDADGNAHQFDASRGQYVRVWVKPQVEERSGMLMYPAHSQLGVMGEWAPANPPVGYPTALGTGNLGPMLRGVNIYMQLVPVNAESGENFMLARNADGTPNISENPVPGRTADAGRTGSGTVNGRVWLESGKDEASSGTSLKYRNPDAPAEGYKVYLTTLTGPGAADIAGRINGMDDKERPGTIAQLIQQNPDYLAKTWVATTDAKGEYTLVMGDEFTNDNIYAWVEDPNGVVVQTHSKFTKFDIHNRFGGVADGWAPNLGANAAIVRSVENLHFAVTGSPMENNLGLYIKNFNTTDAQARRGETAELVIDGALPSRANRIVWTNGAGQIVDPATGEVVLDGRDRPRTDRDNYAGTPIEKCGDEANANLTVPADALDGDTFTAWFYAGPNAIAADSFSVNAQKAADVQPRYATVRVDEDPATDGVQSKAPKFFKETSAGVDTSQELTGEALLADDENGDAQAPRFEFAPSLRVPLLDAEGNQVKEQIEDAEGNVLRDENDEPILVPAFRDRGDLPEGFSIDPATGVVTIPEAYVPASGEAPFVVPVRVVYGDGSQDATAVQFRALKDQAEVYEPSYKDEENLVVPGEPKTSDAPTFTRTNENGEDEQVPVPTDTKFSLPEDYTAPEGYTVEVNPNTGRVTVTAPEDLAEDADESFTVPVLVTYKDGSTDEAQVPFALDRDGNGTADKDEEKETTPPSSTSEQATPEETSTEQPTPEESTTEQPAPEETSTEQPTPEESTTEQPAPEETSTEQPTPEETTTGQTTTDESTSEETTSEQTTSEQTTSEANPTDVVQPTMDNEPKPTDPADDDADEDTDPADPNDPTTVDADEDGVKPVKPVDENQKPGIVVNNVDDETEVEAFDEDNNPVFVEIDEDGNITVNPARDGEGNLRTDENGDPIDIDGPITVIVRDEDLPGGQTEIKVPVEGHKKQEDDNRSGTPDENTTSVDQDNVNSVQPIDKDQETGIVVNNEDDDTKIIAFDEDGSAEKPNIDVSIDKDGKVFVNPGENVDGPIVVIVTDPELPGGQATIVVPVVDADGNEHKLGVDDNNSNPSITEGTNAKDPVFRGETTIIDDTVNNPDGVTGELVYKDEDGNFKVIPDSEVEIDKDGNIKVTVPGNAPAGDAWVSIKDKDGNEIGKIKVQITDRTPIVEGEDGKPNELKPGEKTELDDKVRTPGDVADAKLFDKDGNEITGAKITVGEDGTITVEVPEGTPEGPAKVKLYDKDGNLIAEIDVTIGGNNTGNTGAAGTVIPGTAVDQLNRGESTKIDDKIANPTEDMGGYVLDNAGKRIEGATVKVDPKTGEITVFIPANAKPGNATVVVTDAAGNPVEGANFKAAITNKLTQEELGKCIPAAVGGLGLPLLALIPIGLLATTGVPAIEPAIQQFNAQIEAANTAIQKQLGIFNPQMAAQAAELNAQLKEFGLNMVTGAAVLVLIPAAIAGGVLTAKYCTPGDEIASSSNR